MLTVGLIKYDMTEKSGGERVASILSRELAKYDHVHLISINGKGEEPFYAVDIQSTSCCPSAAMLTHFSTWPPQAQRSKPYSAST